MSSHFAEIVLMGGNAFCGGNASPAAEANILNDPEAADIVFGAAGTVVNGAAATVTVLFLAAFVLFELPQSAGWYGASLALGSADVTLLAANLEAKNTQVVVSIVVVVVLVADPAQVVQGPHRAGHC